MEKNKELIATIEHQNNVIKSLSKLFLTVYEIDLLNNKLYEYINYTNIIKAKKYRNLLIVTNLLMLQ